VLKKNWLRRKLGSETSFAYYFITQRLLFSRNIIEFMMIAQFLSDVFSTEMSSAFLMVKRQKLLAPSITKIAFINVSIKCVVFAR
jgi:hypothetical protein